MSSGRGIPRKALDDRIISPNKLRDGLLNAHYLDAQFPSGSPNVAAIAGFGDPTGVNGNFNWAKFIGPFGGQATYFIIGTQAILAPQVGAANGLLAAGLDLTTAEGVEYLFGGLQTDVNPLGGSPLGTRGNHFIRHKFQLDDVSVAAEVAIGFRGAEAAHAAIDDYTDMAVINIQAGVVNIETIVGGAATVTTPMPGISTLADDDVVTCEVQIKGAHPTYIFTNHTKNESLSFQVPVAEDLANDYVPFSHFLQGAAGCLWEWYRVTCGDVEDDQESLEF
jgi:hypothetical protein